MSPSRMGNGLRFFLTTAIWALGLVAVAVVNQVLNHLMGGGGWRPLFLLWQVPSWLGLFLAFTTFAGGLSVSWRTTLGKVAIYGIPVVLLSFVLSAYVEPLVQVELQEARGMDVVAQHPFGPSTPGGLKAQKDFLEGSPPGEYRYGVEDPFSSSPGWVGFRLHVLFVIPLFGLLAGLLGHQVGLLTTALSPPTRRNVRWAVGLAGTVVFFLALMLAGEWVRSDPQHPGATVAWLPLALPLAELTCLVLLVRRFRRRRFRDSIHRPEP